MPNNTELIEASIVVLAALACCVSALMLRRAWGTWRAAATERRCEAVRLLAWLRVRNEVFRLAISAGVTYAGLTQAMNPAPLTPSPNRAILQVIWLMIAVLCLAKSILNERDTRRVMEIVERERGEKRG